jgi:hypothetical protein
MWDDKGRNGCWLALVLRLGLYARGTRYACYGKLSVRKGEASLTALMVSNSGAFRGVQVTWPGPDILETGTGNTIFHGKIWRKQNCYGTILYVEGSDVSY